MARFAAAVSDRRLSVLKQTVFAPAESCAAGMRALKAAAGTVDWPVTWVDGASCYGESFAGMQAHGIVGPEVATHCIEGRVVARSFEDADALWCAVGDVCPSRASRPPGEQTSETFADLERALRSAGLDFSAVARTWLYLDDMLSWYGELNAARTAFFREHRVFDRLVPASTGIGARNGHGGALVLEALALQPRNARVRVEGAPSPLQGSARDYGSSFSRAVEIRIPTSRRLLISGTASIDLDGRTAHVGDVEGQIDLTMRVVDALLRSRCLSFEDVTRAVAYYRRADDAPAFAAHARRYGLPDLPIIHARDEVCRDDLLFEIEVDAIAEV